MSHPPKMRTYALSPPSYPSSFRYRRLCVDRHYCPTGIPFYDPETFVMSESTSAWASIEFTTFVTSVLDLKPRQSRNDILQVAPDLTCNQG